MSYLEENTRYVFKKMWQKMFFPIFFTEFVGVLCSMCGAFFLLSRYAPPCDLVIFSVFSPFLAIEKTARSFFSDGGSQFFTFKKGEKDLEGAQHIFSEMITCYGTFFLFLLGLCIWRMPDIVTFLKLQSDWTQLAVNYGRLFLVSLCFSCLTTTLQRFLTCDSMPGFTAITSFSSSVLNVIGAVVMIAFFRKGVMGYAIANLFVCVLIMVVCLIPFFLKMTTIRIQFRRIRFQTVRKVFSLVIGSIAGSLIFMGCSVFINRSIMINFTPDAVTILALCFVTIDKFNSIINHSYGQASILIISMFLGEQNSRGIRMTFRRALAEGMIVKIIVMLGFIIFAPLIVFLFPVQQAFPGEAVMALRLFALTPVFYFVSDRLISYFGARGMAKYVIFWLSIPQNIILITVTSFLIFFVKNEHIFWLCHPVRSFLEMLTIIFISYIYSRHKGYKNILMLKDDEKGIPAYHFLVSKNTQEFSDYREMLSLYLRKNSVTQHSIDQTLLLFEELYLFAIHHGAAGNKRRVAIQIKNPINDCAELSVRFEYKGKKVLKLFDSSLQRVAPDQIAGGQILAKLSDTIYIDRICGFIYIRLTKKLKFMPSASTGGTAKSPDTGF